MPKAFAPTRAAIAALCVALGGCGGLLPDIPLKSAERHVVSLDARSGILCGAFDTGGGFCGKRELDLPYPELNERGTGRALQVAANESATCALFESGDVWCATWGRRPAFVERPRGIGFQSMVLGEGFGCAVDNERNVDCWGNVVQLPAPGELESKLTGVPVPRASVRASEEGSFRLRGFGGVTAIRGQSQGICALAGDELRCADYRQTHVDYGEPSFEGGDFGRGADCDPLGGDRDPFGRNPDPFSPFDGASSGCDDASDPFAPRDRQVNAWRLGPPRTLEVERVRAFGSRGELRCAVDQDDRVRCWGLGSPLAPRTMVDARRRDADRRTADEEDERPSRLGSIEVPELRGAAAFEMGETHACALSTSAGPTADPRSIVAETNKGPERAGQLWCWGENEWGQLGNAVNAKSSLPVRVQGLDDVEAFAVMASSTCAIAAGELYCWGYTSALPELERPGDDPCLNPKAVCVPHKVIGFEPVPTETKPRSKPKSKPRSKPKPEPELDPEP